MAELVGQRLGLWATIVLLMSTCGPSAIFAQSDDSTTAPLRWKLSPGDQLAINIAQTSHVVTKIDRRTVEHDTRMNATVAWKVVDVDSAGVATIEQTLTQVHIKMEAPSYKGPQLIEYDSNDTKRLKGPAQKLRKGLKPLLNQPIMVKMNALGKVISVEVPEATLQSLQQVPESQRHDSPITIETLKELFSQATLELPESRLEPGQSWQTERPFQLPPLQYQRKLTFTIGEGDATDDEAIQFTGAIEPLEQQPMSDEDYSIQEQSFSGTAVFDRTSGFLKSHRSETKLVIRNQHRDQIVASELSNTLYVETKRVGTSPTETAAQ